MFESSGFKVTANLLRRSAAYCTTVGENQQGYEKSALAVRSPDPA
jgi:hypothetical protein